VIIATELPEMHVKKLAHHCCMNNIPLLITRINGLIGSVRVLGNEHKVVETNPDFPPIDLRLSDPFPDLLAYCDSVNLEELDSQLHSHVPYPVILVKASQIWKETHLKPPSNRTEENEFKGLIRSMMRNVSPAPEEENFTEALNRAYLTNQRYSIPDEIQSILNDDKAVNLHDDQFWIIANAVRQFVHHEGQGKLPLMGTVPDMHSDTDSFINLQGLYVNKSTQDMEHVKRYVKHNLQHFGKTGNEISDYTIKLFCRNSLLLKVIRYRSLDDELFHPIVENLQGVMMDFLQEVPEPGNGIWYILLRATERFYTEHKRYPGTRKDYAEDYYSLKTHVEALLKEFSLEPNTISDEPLFELCRFGNCQIHSIAAFVGGVTAQEAIKLITKKWIPLNNTFIYNGIKASSSFIEM